MFADDQYALLDCGRGRKLERFGAVVLDRPAPAAQGTVNGPTSVWQQAAARFETDANQGRGRWKHRFPVPENWGIGHGTARFALRLTPFGHVGVFPEQAANWDWVDRQVRRQIQGTSRADLQVLNLFAHTGGSTLAAAAAGARVVHVDSARNVVAWARANAELSDLADAPIRWITEDAVRFAERELRRGNRYDAVILDPPSFGRGPRQETWKLQRDLPRLLAQCVELTAGQPQFVLLTWHSTGLDQEQMREMMSAVIGCGPAELDVADLNLLGRRKLKLASGVAGRWAVA